MLCRHRADIKLSPLKQFSLGGSLVIGMQHSFQRHFWLPHLVPRMLSLLGVRHGDLSFDDLTRPWEQPWGETESGLFLFLFEFLGSLFLNPHHDDQQLSL